AYVNISGIIDNDIISYTARFDNINVGQAKLVYITLSNLINVTNFSPTNLTGCALWFDAADPLNTGTPPANGTSITTWYDKSGYNRNATANTGITYNTTGLNNKPALTFTNSQWLLGSVPITGNTLTIFAIVNMTPSKNNARVLSLSAPNTYDFNNISYMNIGRMSNTGLVPDRNGVTTGVNPPSYSTPYLFECWFDGTKMYSTVQMGNSTSVVSAASSGNFNISSFAIGSNCNTTDTNGYFYGFISEIIVYNTSLSISDRQQVEGYLSWKWGLQANLPTVHPYYNSPPTLLNNIINSNNNYQLFNPIITGNIFQKLVVVQFTGIPKIYDGTLGTILSYTLSGIIPGDIVDISNNYYANYSDIYVGLSKTVTISNIVLTSLHYYNYYINPNNITYNDIYVRLLTPTFFSIGKVFDRNSFAPVYYSLSGFV
ncbi:MAG: hypothetical protein EBS09_12095, partial [Flavobacteriia bacterium]|nr:hypothetical protein [Flavobacteriia bacterium]